MITASTIPAGSSSHRARRASARLPSDVWTGPPRRRTLPGRTVSVATATPYPSALASDLVELLGEVVDRLVRRLLALQRRVGLLLDGGGHLLVVGGDGPRLRGLHALLQGREEGELRDQLGVVVQGGPRRRVPGQADHLLGVVLVGRELHELDRGRLLLGEGADGEVQAAQRAGAGAGEAGQRGDADLALDLVRRVGLGGQAVD